MWHITIILFPWKPFYQLFLFSPFCFSSPSLLISFFSLFFNHVCCLNYPLLEIGKMAAHRTAIRKTVWVREWEGSVWTCVMCMCVSEGQLDLARVPGAGRPVSFGKEAPATAAGTPKVVWLWHRNHTIMKGRAAVTRSSASTPPRLDLDTALDCTAIVAKVALPHLQTLELLPPWPIAPGTLWWVAECMFPQPRLHCVSHWLQDSHITSSWLLNPLGDFLRAHLSGSGQSGTTSSADPRTPTSLATGS